MIHGHEPGPGQGQKVLSQRAGFARVKHHAAMKVAAPAKAVAKRADALRIRRRNLFGGFDLQRHQSAVLFQNEIHLAPPVVTPVINAPAGRIKRTPGLQGLKQGLLQPKALVQPSGKG